MEKINHTVLIVDDEKQVAKSLGRLLKSIGLQYICLESGMEGLEALKSASDPFSLIISDQRMPGMSGSEFLEKAKEISPDTIRFLLTGYSDMDAITDAVNKGSIHKYISKPWDNKDFEKKVLSALNQFELAIENERLFKLAKEQNAKLYQLNSDLKKSSAAHGHEIAELNREMEQLIQKRSKESEDRDYISEIEAVLRENKMVEKTKLNLLYKALVSELYEQFQDIALRNGFEMPEQGTLN